MKINRKNHSLDCTSLIDLKNSEQFNTLSKDEFNKHFLGNQSSEVNKFFESN